MKTFKYEVTRTYNEFYEIEANNEGEAYEKLLDDMRKEDTLKESFKGRKEYDYNVDYKGCEDIEEDEGDEEPKDEYNRQPSNLE